MWDWIKEKVSLILLKYHETKYALLVIALLIVVIICFVVPWLYGSLKICLMIYNGG